jgi:putative tricarboxylic transport membrane protein
MAIGVPGGATSAVMMVVLQYQGIVLGPRLFLDTPELAYGVFFYMTMSYAVMLLTILPLARYMSKVVFMPTRIIVPLIITLTIIGAFANRDYLFDMGLALVFAVLGYIAVKTNYHVIAILIGILLGPLFEQYLLRSLRLGQGASTIGNVLWVMVILSLLLPWLRSRQTQRALDKAADTLPGGGRENVR